MRTAPLLLFWMSTHVLSLREFRIQKIRKERKMKRTGYYCAKPTYDDVENYVKNGLPKDSDHWFVNMSSDVKKKKKSISIMMSMIHFQKMCCTVLDLWMV